VRDDLTTAAETLARAGIPSPRADAEWLLAGLLGEGRAALALRLDRALDGDVARRYHAAVRRRAGREPLQRILGWEAFRGVRVCLTKDVLVPRPETEMLVEWSLALVPSPSLVLDVGTGSGCIACAVAAERPAARVIAVDASPAAALVARANALRLGLGERVRVVATDLLTALRHAGADLIVANLPYVPTPALDALSPEVRDHEPRAAVDGGPDGLREIRRLVASAAAALTRDGVLVLETLGGTQTPVVAALMRTAGFTEVTTRADLTGVERFVAGRWS
jgi:release factor glutamine methyltransferase